MFSIDERILSTSFHIGDWPLSRIFLKNEECYPWFILVPRKDNIQEIYQLLKEERQILIEEINQLSQVVNKYFIPDKLNIGALGNVVSQLHIHVVARTKNDALWPQGLWQSSLNTTHYKEERLNILLPIIRDLIKIKGDELKAEKNSFVPDKKRL